MSASDVLRTANSNAKFGAAETEWGWLASCCIQLAGLRRNASGLISNALGPASCGALRPMMRPMSW